MEKLIELNLPSAIQKIEFNGEMNWFVKRDDLIHPEVSGNKYRKLKYLIQDYYHQRKSGIITFGGSFSNHIYSVAAYCSLLNIPSIGIIRGEADEDNPTLKFAVHKGMQLFFVSRMEYRNKTDSPAVKGILDAYPDYYIIPEGGDHSLAEPGVAEVIHEMEAQDMIPDFLAVAAGTGTTASALIKTIKQKKWPTRVLVFSVVNDSGLLMKIVNQSGGSKNDFDFIDQYTLGGYAKTNTQYLSFIKEFTQQTSVPVDPIYNGKLIYGLNDLINQGYFKSDSRMLWLHTGGLQGNIGLNYIQNKKALRQVNQIPNGDTSG